MKTIEDFCDTHDACSRGRTWALANCSTMQEAWDTAPDPSWVLWIATRKGVLTDRELRLFAVWCARQGQHLLTDPRSINAIDVSERYANGEATDEELAAARDAARAAFWAAEEGAAWATEEGAAWATDRDAADAAASAAARTAVLAAEGAAAWAADWAAADAAAWAAAWAADRAADGAAAGVAARGADGAAAGVAAWAAARTAQAQWLRENTKPNFA
jgi:hypothetical protein